MLGHINVASGHGPWPEGFELLAELRGKAAWSIFRPAHYAVIFSSRRTAVDEGYGAMADRMEELAAGKLGFSVWKARAVRMVSASPFPIGHRWKPSRPGVRMPNIAWRKQPGGRSGTSTSKPASRAWNAPMGVRGRVPVSDCRHSSAAVLDCRATWHAVSLACHAQSRVPDRRPAIRRLCALAAALVRRLVPHLGRHGQRLEQRAHDRVRELPASARISGAGFLAAFSVYLQLAIGVGFVLGVFTRWAGIFCAIHFAIAIAMVDRHGGMRAYSRRAAWCSLVCTWRHMAQAGFRSTRRCAPTRRRAPWAACG